MKQKIDLNKLLDKCNEETWQAAKKRTAEIEKYRKYADTFRRLSYFYDTTVYTFGQPILQLNTSSIKEAEAALEMIEDEHNVTFDRSSDTAGESYAERTFSAEGLDFRVDVRVAGDACKSVLVGFETVPKYEIRCDEEEIK